MKSLSLSTQKDWEVIVDLGLDEKHVVHAYFRAKVPALAELAAKDKYGKHCTVVEVKELKTRHKPKAPATTTKKRKRPGPKPLAKAEPAAPPKPQWRPMSRVINEKQRQLDEKTFRN